MPKDDWAKYARRDRGRKALREGNYFRAGDDSTDRVAKPKKHKKHRGLKSFQDIGLFTIVYNRSTPETSTVRYISGPIHEGIPPWPGFG